MAMTEEQAERMLAEMNEVIRAGEEMRRLRAEMIEMFAALGWSQEKIARIAGMSQPAVSKQMARHRTARHRTDDARRAPSAPRLSLDQYDTPWLEGRLWGLAEEISEICESDSENSRARHGAHGTARCARAVAALARGKKGFTPRHVDELRRLVEADLRLNRAELPGSYQAAYDQIARGLDVPPKGAAYPADDPAGGPAADPAPVPASPSARRALACRIQRDVLRADA
ncbi:sigma-70 family RNA polymerase sigma factor [Streptomyces sp. NPDC059009]|uniref:sigma-70 family RNA polymerase sigma factor n=1 Tax=Streptomyces sp. NPDC059009 TaxID=3346694 RepID=UPI0036B4330E